MAGPSERIVLTNSWKIGTKVNSCDDAKLRVKLRRPAPGGAISVQPSTEDEPLFRPFRCGRVAVRHEKRRHYAANGEIVITARRVLVLLNKGPTGKGAFNFTVMSAGRDELCAPNTKKDRNGKVTEVELSLSDGSGSIHVSSLREPFAALLEMLAPESAGRLGPQAAAARQVAKQEEQARKQEEQARRLEAERQASQEKAQKAASLFQQQPEPVRQRSPVSISVGSMLDHRKTWHYRVAASEAQCLRAFANAFSAGGGLLSRAKWDLRAGSDSAVATYQGRKGIIAAVTALSETASAEQEGAVGSEVKFEVVARDGDHVICAMWLASYGSRLGFTNDARFFRPYMRAVEDELRRLDPATQVVKE